MIYSIWLWYTLKNFKSYSTGIIIFLFILNVSDLVTGSNKINEFNSQVNKNENHIKRNINMEFCKNENMKSLLYHTSLGQYSSSRLSSNQKPLNQKNSSSSTTSVVLPQGNENVESSFELTHVYSSVKRIEGYERTSFFTQTGCIDLRYYNWKYTNSESLSGVQIFLFYLYDIAKVVPINVDLRILIDSSQDAALNRPIVIVLSSFLPRKFFLSAISFLLKSKQPLHIILTHLGSEVVIKDEQPTSEYAKKLFISVIHMTPEENFISNDKAFNNDFITIVHQRFWNSNIYKHGYFIGYDYHPLRTEEKYKKIWLFNNEQLFTVQKVERKIVTIYVLDIMVNLIDLVLGKVFPLENQSTNSHAINCQRNGAINEVVKAYTRYAYDVDPYRTCTYNVINSVSPVNTKYRNITWLHIKSVTNTYFDIQFMSHEMNVDNAEKYLLILTGNDITNCTIKFRASYFDRVHILTNISWNQIDRAVLNNSELSIQSIADLPGTFQYHAIVNHISAGSAAIMQTTIYQFERSSNYEIRIFESKLTFKIIPECKIYAKRHITISITIDVTNQHLTDIWKESQFLLGNNSCIFDKKNNSLITITKNSNECSSYVAKNKYSNKIYAILYGKKYDINVNLKFYCQKIDKPSVTKSPNDAIPKYIPKADMGFHVFNNSNFNSNALNSVFYDREIIYVEILNGERYQDEIQLRDCYLSNVRAKLRDFQINGKQHKLFKKVTIVHEGCFDGLSDWYRNTSEDMKPKSYFEFVRGYSIYRFALAINGKHWADKLSFENQWDQEGQFKVHLYCGTSRCNYDKVRCRPQSDQCSNRVLTNVPEMKYFGVVTIIRNDGNVILKIFILISLFVIILLLLCLISYCICKSLKHRNENVLTIDKMMDQEQIMDSGVTFINPQKKRVNLNYQSLKLLTKNDKKSSVKLYSEPTLFASLKYMVENCDKSIYLQAGYLNTPVVNSSQSMVTTAHSFGVSKRLKAQSQSLMDINSPEPHTFTNYFINSWPLSSTDQKYKSQGQSTNHRHYNQSLNINKCKSNKPSSSWCQNTNSSGDSIKQKVSSTLHSEVKSSDHKASSNRTTVSESMSTNEMTNKFSTKWWSLLTNYWVNQNVVMSRN